MARGFAAAPLKLAFPAMLPSLPVGFQAGSPEPVAGVASERPGVGRDRRPDCLDELFAGRLRPNFDEVMGDDYTSLPATIRIPHPRAGDDD